MASAAMRISDANMVRVGQDQTREAESKERGGGKGAGRWRFRKTQPMQTYAGCSTTHRGRRTGGRLTGEGYF